MARDSAGRDSDADAALSALMAAAQAGDRAAYERLLRESVPLIKRVVRRAGTEPDRVDDVVQDVLITIHRARSAYDPARSYSAWVSVIAQRRAIDALRQRGRLDRREIFAPLAYENAPDDEARTDAGWEAEQRGRVIDAALASLPAGQREAIEKLAIGQLSLDDAARETGKTKGALKVNLHRALKSLRSRFGGAP